MMLDEKDLQSISELMDKKISASEARMEEKINDSQAQTMAMMEAYFEPQFKLLGEQLKLFQETLQEIKSSYEVQDKLEARTRLLEVAVKQHSREIEALKRAQ